MNAENAIREKAEKATPGPWRDLDLLLPGPGRPDEHTVASSRYDAQFIAACSPEVVVAMADVIRAARAVDKVLGHYASIDPEALIPECREMRDTLAAFDRLQEPS